MMVGKKYIRRVGGGGVDFCPHSIILSLEIHSIPLWLTGMVVCCRESVFADKGTHSLLILTVLIAQHQAYLLQFFFSTPSFLTEKLPISPIKKTL